MDKKSILNKLSNQNWEDIIIRLTDFASKQLKFWNLINEKKTKGLLAEDIAMDTIEKVIKGEWNWDPEKSDLLDYLKFHVVRGLVSNLAKSKKIKLNSNFDITDLRGIKDSVYTVESEINANEVLNHLQKIIKGNEIEEKILEGIINGLKKNEIINEYKMTKEDYNNGYKRVKRKVMNIDLQLLLRN